MKLINPEIRIENCNTCNALCTICPREQMTRPKTTMDFRLFTKLVDEGRHLGAKTISIFGFGEPLLDKDIVRRISYCSSWGLETFITTNAMLLDLQTGVDLMKAGLSHIRFSIHGLLSRHYEEVHRGCDFTEVMRHVFNFVRWNEKKNNGRTTVSVTVIPCHDEKIEDIRHLWERDGIDYLEIWRPHNWATMREYRAKTEKEKGCGRPFTGPVQIQADGDVIPCCFLTNAEIVLGSVKEKTIEEILKDRPYEILRDRHRRKDYNGLPCEHCDQRFILDENPLLYSNRDPERKLDKTSSTKFAICEECG